METKYLTPFFFFKEFYFLFWIATLVSSFPVKLSSVHRYFKVDLSNVLCLELPCYHGLTPTKSQAKTFVYSPGWNGGQNWKSKSEGQEMSWFCVSPA